MNPQETQQVAARDEKWVPSAERVKISSTNIILETTVPQKEETFQAYEHVYGSYAPAMENSGSYYQQVPFFWKDSAKATNDQTRERSPKEKKPAVLVDIGKKRESRRENMPYPRLESYQMFIKYSTNQIPPKKSRGKGSKGQKTAEESHETVDVSVESKPEPKPAKKKTASRRVVKKKFTLSADDNIISDDPGAALELAMSISQAEVEEAEAARKVYATYARIVTESVSESAKKMSSGRSSKSVVIEDTPSALKSKPATSKAKLKGALSLTPAEQEAANIMQALKESKKTSRRQPGTGGSNEGTGSKPGVPEESTVVSATSSEGTGAKPGVPDEDKDITEEKVILEWGDEQDSKHSDDRDEKDGDADDEGDDHVSDTQDADDEDVETEFDKDDIYKYKIRVRNDEDEEMKDAEVEGSDKGDEEITDAAKEEAKKTSEAKKDTKKTELPPSSSSLSVSSGFGDQFLKLSSDSSLVSTFKDSADVDIPVLVILETTNLPPIPEIVTETPVTTADPSPQVTPIISTVQQTTTPIPTPTITIDALTITTAVPESNALTAVELRVAKLEKYVFELKTGDHFSIALVVLQSYVPTVVDSYLDTKVGDVFQKELQKHTANLIYKYSLQHLPELTKKPTPTTEQEYEKSLLEILKIKKEQAESQKNLQFTIKSTNKAALKEYDLKSDLYQSMHANKSFNRNPANHRLYHALMKALIEDENAMDKGVTNTVKDHKRKHDDDEHDDDEDPPARPNQGKKTKRRRTKEFESSKKPSTTKETPKGKAPTKGCKSGKSALAKDPVKEPIADVIMDDAGDDLQPPRPPTPDPEWNERQVVLDQPTQPWFNQMVSASKDPLTFNDLMATPIDFSKYVLNGHKIENLTQDILLGLAFNLLKGTCSSKYLKTSDLEVTYTTYITKTKAARYEIKGIADMVNKFSKQNVYSTKVILGVKSVSVKKLHGYGHLEEIVVKRSDQQLYKFKEGDFVDLHLNDIEDMLLFVVQHKLFHLNGNVIVDFIVALRMFTRSLILKRRVEDLQLGVESYQKKLNITKPQKTFPKIEFKEPYTPSYDPPGIVYEDLNKLKRVLRADELYKFSDGTLKSVRDEIHHRVLDFRLDYNTEMPKRKWMAVDRKRSGLMIELIDKQLREREIIRNLERLVGARELEMDYKLMMRTV
ncbi:hypothetical protein Tco_0597515 [Tanacetum coccineum]